MFVQSDYQSASLVTSLREHLIGMFRALKMARTAHSRVLPQADDQLVQITCKQARKRGLPVYLFGASNEKLAATALKLIEQYPGLRVAGWEAPPSDFNPHSIDAGDAVRRIAESGAKLCLVILGASAESRFAKVARETQPDVGFVCVGLV